LDKGSQRPLGQRGKKGRKGDLKKEEEDDDYVDCPFTNQKKY